MLFVASAAFALVASPLHAATNVRADAAPVMRMNSAPVSIDRRAFCSLAAAGVVFAGASVPAAHAGTREEGVALLRKRAADTKANPTYGPPPNFTKGPIANKCNMEKPCKDGAGIKWDPKALGVQKAETRKFDSTRKNSAVARKPMPMGPNAMMAAAPAPAPSGAASAAE